jgi:hypothetical protein
MPDSPDEPLSRRLAREANERRQREQSRVMDMSLKSRSATATGSRRRRAPMTPTTLIVPVKEVRDRLFGFLESRGVMAPGSKGSIGGRPLAPFSARKISRRSSRRLPQRRPSDPPPPQEWSQLPRGHRPSGLSA